MDLKNKLFMRFCLESESGGKAPYGSRLSPDKQAYFRALWTQFVQVRQILGTCIQCNRKHQPGMQRCGVHRNKNRAKCLAWAAANREAIRAEYKSRVNAGVCANGPKHGNVYNGHTLCKMCYDAKYPNRKTP